MAINVAEITSVLKTGNRRLRAAARRSAKSAPSSKSATASPASTACATPWPASCSNSRAASWARSSTSKKTPSAPSSSATTWRSRKAISVRATGRLLEVPVGDAVIGRVVNPLGQPLDGGPAIASQRDAASWTSSPPASPSASRSRSRSRPASRPSTRMIPIGRGQRELIIGDRKTGKTAIAIDTIINQKGTGREVLLRRHRPEGIDASPASSKCSASTARWTTPPSSSPAPPTRPRCSTSPPTPAAPWPSTSCGRASTRCASTTTCPSRPPPIASSRCCCAARPAARPIPATCSTSTAACSSAP